MMKVKFLVILNNDPWAPIFFRCGHCNSPVPSDGLEHHAKSIHGVDDIELVGGKG